MQYQTLSDTDITVSRMTLGCWALAGGFNWGAQEERDSIATLHTALDAGITFFDTAEAYGNGYSEEIIGKAFQANREEVVIASKALPSHLTPESLITACEGSLKRLKTDYLDLYILHWYNPEVPIADTMGAMTQLKQQGKIRTIGVSNLGPEYLGKALDTGVKIVSNQMAYNLLFRAVEGETLSLCKQHLVDVHTYSPLMQGLLTGKFATVADVPADRARTRHFSGTREHSRHGEEGHETLTFQVIDSLRAIAQKYEMPMGDLALAWLLAQEGVGSIITGARNPNQIQRNVKATEHSLSSELLEEVEAATIPLKEAMGPNIDLWQGGDKSRIR